MKKWRLLIRGWIRYQLGLCPNCKGEIPKDFYCFICANYGNTKCPDAITCLAWWRRFKEFTCHGRFDEGVAAELVDLNAELEEIENQLREGRASHE